MLPLIASGQETNFKVSNTSVNSNYAELGIRFLNDLTVTYASSKKVAADEAFNKTRRRRQRQLSLAIYTAQITENGDLVHQNRFFDKTQDHIEMGDFAIAPDGKTIFFTWNNYFPYMIDTIPNYWSNLRIMKGTITADNEIDIPNAEPLPFINARNNYNHVTLSADGKTLYFSSDLPKGSGGMDIYKVDILADGNYSEPQNLGKKVNSSQDEIFPFIDAANNLYFSSYGHRGRGGLDIFKSPLVNGEFQAIEKLKEPVNSKSDDFGFIINPTTNKGYFTSYREGGQGDVDIYAFEPDIPDCSQNLLATFIDTVSSEQLKKVQVSVFDQQGELLNAVYVTQIRAIPLALPCDSRLTLKIEKEGFETLESQIETTGVYDLEIEKIFKLKAIPCTQFVVGDILHKLELKAVNDVEITVMANDTIFAEHLISNTNSFNIEVPCKSEYKLIAYKPGFETVNATVRTGKKFQDTISKKILLTPKICRQTIDVAVFDVESTSAVSKFKTRLLLNGNLVDEKNIIYGNAFQFFLNCNENYTVEVIKEGFESTSFFVSTSDEYDVAHKKDLRIQPIPCSQYVVLEGTTEIDRKALASAHVKILRDDIEIATSNPMGKIKLPCHSNITLEISSPGFVTKSLKVKTTGVFEHVHKMRASLKPYVCEQEFTLTVADNNTKAGLSTFNIEINDGASIKSKHIRNGSVADIKLKCDTNYRFKIEQNDYETMEFTLNTTGVEGEQLSKTIFLTPLVCEQIISGKIVDAKTGSAINKALVTISSGNVFTKILSLDVNGNFSFTADCETAYILKAAFVNYGSEELKITTTKERSGSIQKNIELHRDLEFTTIAGKRVINTNNIAFELNKIDISTETAIELNKVAALLRKYPELKILVKSHTDSRAPDHLNLNLTKGRARQIREYLVSQGIDPTRISAKGLGETELLNKCSNGVKCSDEEHRRNRRTEFIVSN